MDLSAAAEWVQIDVDTHRIVSSEPESKVAAFPCSLPMMTTCSVMLSNSKT